MERGRITARGTHQELLRSSPLYQHLSEIQFALQPEGTAEPLVPAGVNGTNGAGDGMRGGVSAVTGAVGPDGASGTNGAPKTVEVAR
jgi:hypothetical protein